MRFSDRAVKLLLTISVACLIIVSSSASPAEAAGGALDPTFGVGGTVSAPDGGLSAIAIQPLDQKIVAVGECGGHAFCVVRYNTNGSLDGTFGAGGVATPDFSPDTEQAYAVAIQPADGKIVVGGSCNVTANGFNEVFCVLRLNTNGTPDSTFGTGGWVSTDFTLDDGLNRIKGVAIQTDGSIVGAGFCLLDLSNHWKYCLARWSSTGVLDAGFGVGGQVVTTFLPAFTHQDDEAKAVLVQPADQKIIAAGYCNTPGGTGGGLCLARYNTNGTLDTAGFGGGTGKVTTNTGGGGAYALTLQSNGKIIVAGSCSAVACLHRYNTDGGLDGTFGTLGKVVDASGGTAIATQVDDKIITAGACSAFCLTRYNASDGSPDPTFGSGGTVTTAIGDAGSGAAAVAIQADEKIVAGGTCYFGHPITSVTFCLARYLPAGGNLSPTDIALAPQSVPENMPVGTTVGTLSTTDPDAADTFTYSLVPGSGDTGNGSFTLVGNSLNTAAVFDFETTPSYSIRVRTMDNGGLFFEEAFTINVTNVNEMPLNVALAPQSVPEGMPGGTTVGTFSTVDPDAGDTFTYSLVAGAGDTDNGSFTVPALGNALRTNAVFDFETKSVYNIRVRSTDSGGLWVENTFAISVTNVDEGPTDISLSQSSLPENMPIGTTIGTFATTDPDIGDTSTYSLVAGVGDTDNGSFAIPALGNALRTNAVFDYETKLVYNIRVRSTDSGGLFFEKTFSISVTNVNEPPVALDDTYAVGYNTPLTVFGPGVLANDSDPDAGAVIGAVLVTGPASGSLTLNPDGSFTYTPAVNFAGADSFTYKAGDGLLQSTLASVTLNVANAAAVIANQPNLSNGQKNALQTQLNNAQKHFANGNLNAACNQLDAFIRQVQALSPGKISAADAQILIADVQAQKQANGCP